MGCKSSKSSLKSTKNNDECEEYPSDKKKKNPITPAPSPSASLDSNTNTKSNGSPPSNPSTSLNNPSNNITSSQSSQSNTSINPSTSLPNKVSNHTINGQTFKKQLHLETSSETNNGITPNDSNHNSLGGINQYNQSTNSIGINKRPSLLSLSNESSLNDITVNIPDPFRSNYKVTDSLYHKNYRKLYRGIDKNRREVLVEFTELRPYESAGFTQVDFFNRIDILRQMDHISIPKVLDVFDGPDVNRVVFDYFPGKDLDCLLKMKGSLPPHVCF